MAQSLVGSALQQASSGFAAQLYHIPVLYYTVPLFSCMCSSTKLKECDAVLVVSILTLIGVPSSP